jgi:hypothetical protein
MAAQTVNIRISAYDAGCLRPLLSGKIDEVDRHIRVNADSLSEEALNYAKLYRAQLRGCLAAVEKWFT